MVPQKYDIESYTKWHEEQFPSDKPLFENINKIREDLINSSRENLIFLSEILESQFPRCQVEYETNFHIPTNYETPLTKHVLNTPDSNFQTLFKTTESIINKMWRKAMNDNPIEIKDLSHSIHDLVRSEIISTTLGGACFLVDRMNFKHWNLLDQTLTEKINQRIKSVNFESEMKMGSGYFAYHGQVVFQDGLEIELQVYSELSQQWRLLSHLYYEKARLLPSQKFEFGSKEAKLISLGHLLHVAEWELQVLINDFLKSK